MWDRVERERKLFVEEMLLLPTIIVYHFAVKFVCVSLFCEKLGYERFNWIVVSCSDY